jgi:transcriptional regulator with XRE-family HTH domain
MTNKIIKRLLELSELSQKDFADKINVPPQRVSEWVNGVRNPKISKLNQIASIFGYKISLNFEILKSNDI